MQLRKQQLELDMEQQTSAGMGRWAAASDEGGVVRASLGLGGSPGDGARGGASQRRGATGPWPPGGRPHPRDAAGRPDRKSVV